MESLAVTALRYKSDLVEAGCKEAIIDALPAQAEDLKTANTAQEKFKKDRGLITQERVIKLNEIFELLSPVSKIAQIIFADNPAILAKYTLPQVKKKSPAPAE